MTRLQIHGETAAGGGANTLEPINPPEESNAFALPFTPDAIERPKESWFLLNGQETVRNVAVPTLTPFLPDESVATGSCMIVLPGGGFAVASMENEGWPVARWLSEQGIAAFVLKYRLEPTPESAGEFRAAMMRRFAAAAAMAEGGQRNLGATDAAIADMQSALRLVRGNAGDWNIDAGRVGVLGFSAGAITGLEIVSSGDPDTMPDCLAAIYPPMEAIPVPSNAPPLFVVLAEDDALFGRHPHDLPAAWRAAERPVEFHLLDDGGHGFGMGREGTASSGWLLIFKRWLAGNGWLV